MADSEDKNEKKTLSLSSGKLGLKKTADTSQIRQSFSHGRSKVVAVEVKRKRVLNQSSAVSPSLKKGNKPTLQGLSESEWETRLKAVQEAIKSAPETEAQLKKEKEERANLEALRLNEIEQQKQLQEEEKLEKNVKTPPPEENIEINNLPESKEKVLDLEAQNVEKVFKSLEKNKEATIPSYETKSKKLHGYTEEEEEEKLNKAKKNIKSPSKKSSVDPSKSRHDIKNRLYGLSVKDLVNEDNEDNVRTYGSKRYKDKSKKYRLPLEQKHIVREIIIPEAITVQELSNRMAVRGAEVIKKLISMGMMVTITQSIDADTAELLVAEFGHTPKRISASDVEMGILGSKDEMHQLSPRAPVVTVMGHVDHGKTSLLDAIRRTDVVAEEAGGITQHIGAYQVTMASGSKITFIDTPGHAAFTEMRARGANVTDIVILVVAADDGIMPQTIEAIHHARAAKVPLIVAINKIDKPEANPTQVRHMLLQHEVILEELGGDVMSVEISAKKGLNIDKLEEIILLQAEILGLKANPNREANGIVIEAKLERGRGAVATVLIQNGTLNIGDIFVAGSQWGRVRALIDDKGKNQKQALPSQPIEILGFDGAPAPGDDFVVVSSENRAREIAEFRAHRHKNLHVASARSSFEQLLIQAQANKKELAVVIKSDVQGSLEAITNSLEKLSTSEVGVRILHAGVGGINESDVMLAKASNAFIIGFNVRANPQAREVASRYNLELRYYSIIYNVIDDIKAIMGGLLSPTLTEKFLGNATIRQVFTITKVGKVAGCYVTEGIVKRGAKVRLLRDNIVIHEGNLKTLKRIKDEVREVKEGYECGMAFENYHDIREGDIIECFTIEQTARVLE